MEQRVSVITLGSADVARARAFYEALGWRSDCEPDSEAVFFQSGGMVLALWDRDKNAADSGVEVGAGYSGVTLARNVASEEAVDAAIAQAEAAGARVTRRPGPTFWGGYSGVFVDPDGYPWEVAHNPHWMLQPDGSVELAGELPATASQ